MELVSQETFVEQLTAYDKENVPLIVIQKVNKYIQDPRFLPELINELSPTAMCLCMWVRAMVLYDTVVKGLESKKTTLNEAEWKLEKTVEALSLKRSDLLEMEDKVAGLVRTFTFMEEKKHRLVSQMEMMKMQTVRRGK